MGPGQVETTGDHSQTHPTDAGLCIHVAAVEIGEAVRSTGEVWLLLTSVLALADGLPIPDVTGGSLLAADEALAGSCGGGGVVSSSSGQPVWLCRRAVRETCCHTAVETTHVGAAFLKVGTVLHTECTNTQQL